jgi:hypothetical protein
LAAVAAAAAAFRATTDDRATALSGKTDQVRVTRGVPTLASSAMASAALAVKPLQASTSDGPCSVTVTVSGGSGAWVPDGTNDGECEIDDNGLGVDREDGHGDVDADCEVDGDGGCDDPSQP